MKSSVSIFFSLFLLVLFFTTEAYFKIVHFSLGAKPFILQITKGVVFLFVAIYLLVKSKKSIALLLVIFLSFLLGQILLNKGFSYSIFITFIRLLFPIILLLFFDNYKISREQKELLFYFFEKIMLVNSILIVLGFLFNIYIFNSYAGKRFGFNGLFVNSATSSYVYCMTLIYLFNKCQNKVFKNPQNLIIIFSVFLIGTKVAYFFMGTFLLTYFLKFSTFNKKYVISFFVALAMGIIYVCFFKIGIFNEIRLNDSLLSSVMSYRDQLFLEKTYPFIKENWNFINFLFGGISDLSFKSQIEFIDVFLFFGLFGVLLYYYIFFEAFLTFKLNFYTVLMLLILFVLILFAGNFFFYPSIAIYIVILKEQLNTTNNNSTDLL